MKLSTTDDTYTQTARKRKRASKRGQPLATWQAILLGVALGLFLRTFIRIGFVPSTSMEPTIKANSFHVFIRSFRDPAAGDIVLISAKENLVKRIIAVGEQVVTIYDGNVYVNGILLAEEYLPVETITYGNGVYHVPENELFYLGDNREYSCDSRSVGTVSESAVSFILLI